MSPKNISLLPRVHGGQSGVHQYILAENAACRLHNKTDDFKEEQKSSQNNLQRNAVVHCTYTAHNKTQVVIAYVKQQREKSSLKKKNNQSTAVTNT